MVKAFSSDDRAALEQALIQAERQTSAEIAVVVAQASDDYRAIVMSYGLALGSFFALLLWHCQGVTEFPALLSVQLVVPALLSFVPPLRHFCLRFAPARLLRHRAAQRAAAEYLHLEHHLPAQAPVLLLYVSLAERYAHIYTSRAVHEKIPGRELHAVVATLTSAVKSEGLKAALTKAVEHAGEMLKGSFPADGRAHAGHVIELKE
jgi:putative membrane protein